VFQAKTAAEQARDAAQQVRERISALDTIGDLSTAVTILQEIMRLQRTNAWDTVWDIVLDRYATVRVHLVRSEQGTGASKAHQRSIRTALDQFGIIVQEIEGARTSRMQEELDTVRFNRVLSDQIDTLERTRMSVKKAGA
jgi:type II secretory pathway component PulM